MSAKHGKGLALTHVGLEDLVDTYLMFAASAIAANTVARSACGAAAPLFTRQMFAALGVGGGGSLIGGVAVLLAAIPFAFYRYGEGIRIRSKFAPTDSKKGHDESDEAEKGLAGGDDGVKSPEHSPKNLSGETLGEGPHKSAGYEE